MIHNRWPQEIFVSLSRSSAWAGDMGWARRLDRSDQADRTLGCGCWLRKNSCLSVELHVM